MTKIHTFTVCGFGCRLQAFQISWMRLQPHPSRVGKERWTRFVVKLGWVGLSWSWRHDVD